MSTQIEMDRMSGLGPTSVVCFAHLDANEGNKAFNDDLVEFSRRLDNLRDTETGRYAISAVLCSLLNTVIDGGSSLYYTDQTGKVMSRYVSDDTVLRLVRRAMNG